MLDNLKLGFGGTAGEMARLINQTGVMGKGFKATAENVKDVPFDMMIKAINKVQTEMGVTGTTSKEAMETVAGSIGMAKSSLQDFLGGLGNSKADVGQLTSNMVESFGAVVTNIKGVLATIWDNIPMEGWQKQLIAFAVVAGPAILVIGKIAGAISLVITVGAKFIAIGTQVVGAITTIVGVLGGPLTIAIAAAIALGVVLYKNWDTVKEVGLKTWDSITTKVEGSVAKIKELWNGLTEFLKNPIKGTVDFVGKGIDKFFGKDKVGKTKADKAGKQKVDGNHRTGLPRVPKNNYVANLHKDEAVLPKGEAEEWRKGTRKVGNNVVYSPSISITVGQDVGLKTWDSITSKVEGSVAKIKELWNGLTEFLKNPIKGTVDFVGKGIDKFFGKDKVGKTKADKSGKQKVDGSHKTGLSKVPFNGYVGELHKKEEVLTADDPRNQNNNKKIPLSGNNVTYSPSVNITVGQDVGTETKRDLEKTIKNILEREREKFFYKLALQNS